MAALGLRGKSLLALLLACMLALLPAAAIGWLAFQSAQQYFGEAYARNATLVNRERIRAPITRELALSLRLADSEVTRQWLLDEANPAKRELFFREAEGYRRDFRDHAYFLASIQSLGYYFNSPSEPFSTEPRYRLSRDADADRWFFSTLRETEAFNINVDYNPALNTTKVWFNILVRDHAGAPIGLAGSGLDLTSFVSEFLASGEPGVTPMILDTQGAIQAHQNRELIALNSGADGAQAGAGIFALLGGSEDTEKLRSALAEARGDAGSVAIRQLRLDGREQLVALTFIPELGWYVVNGIDLASARVLDSRWLLPLLAALLGLLLVLALIFVLAIERLLLHPLRQLRQGAQAMAGGRYDVAMPYRRDDEIGELSTAFGIMAQKVRDHTQQLEARVRERTRELEHANEQMASAQKKIIDSIDYASLIQRSILPNRELVNVLGEHHAVLWRPRDVVGGDFYIFRSDGDLCLLGVVDCAGHGVPGALMTMLAHAALDQAISDCGLTDPAAILARTDDIVRSMLGESPESQALATNMDVGLALVDLGQRSVTFAGAKIALYFSDGTEVKQLPGARRALGDKRRGQYTNKQLPLQTGQTFYLCTDGFLDQAGGEEGFGFGNDRFAEMLRTHASLPLSEQSEAFSTTLAAYQGEYPQRDDITMLCFRFD